MEPLAADLTACRIARGAGTFDSRASAFAIETEREHDGRWIAEIPTLPGVLAYGATEGAAFAAAEALALRVLADRLERGEADQAPLPFPFVPATT